MDASSTPVTSYSSGTPSPSWLKKTEPPRTSRCPEGSWCWWCCHPFEGPVLHLPFKWDSNRNKFETMGAFCSWGCMKAFNLDRNGVNHGGIVAQNIVVMKKQMCGGEVRPIHAAPSRYALKEFGGHLSIEEFRSIGAATGTVLSLPDEMQRFQVATKKYEPSSVISSSDQKMCDIQSTVASNETLKLKRPKPLKRDVNNLEKSLGIVRKR